VRRLGPDGVEQLALLYRSATSDLAAAQSRNYETRLVGYLNRLVARAHAHVYAGTANGGWSRMTTFFLRSFPQEVRASRGPILACAALFVLASLLAYVLVRLAPLDVYALLPAGEIPTVTRSLHDSNFGFDHDFAPVMSAMIITNNIQVAALAFAGGMSCGLLTFWAVLNNGLMLGGLGALFASKGFGLDFLATIAPHGVLELTAIQIAGGAGFLLASGFLLPGRLRRVDALKLCARRASVLVLGVAAMLVLAGMIEGFITPLRTPPVVRLSIGALTALGLFPYLLFTGRSRDSKAGTQSVVDTGL
jgi:uncharacterized membrane protein SpoIIM required for sporulation